MTDVTQILGRIEAGDPRAAEHLLPLLYDELRKLAAAKLTDEKSGQTLQATALVHEAYIRLVDVEQVQHWNSRGHFFTAAAEAMRRILIEQARHRKRLKDGGNYQQVELSSADPVLDVLALNDALEKLELEHPRKAQLVKLRFFAGITNLEAADSLGISPSTADNDWAYARSWLQVEMSGAETGDSIL